MENYEINKNLNDFKIRINELINAINLEKVNSEIKEYEDLMNNPNFWSNQKQSASILKKIKIAKEKIDKYNKINSLIEELEFYFDIH